MHINYEFKAISNNIKQLEELLVQQNSMFIGEDHQIDTYFNVPIGRLKLREGNIENALIHYTRSNTATAKQSDVLLYQHQPDTTLKQILTKALGVKVVVDKKRRIYFIDNVKFHFDEVKDLGTFVEVEAIDKEGLIGIEKLKEQCTYYANLFNIRNEDYIAVSYSDLLMGNMQSKANIFQTI